MSCKKYLSMTFPMDRFSMVEVLWLLKNMPRMHKKAHRSGLTYLFATYWLYCFSFHSIIFNVPFMRILPCRFGIPTIDYPFPSFSKSYFGRVDFTAAGTLHCKLFKLSWILEASIFRVLTIAFKTPFEGCWCYCSQGMQTSFDPKLFFQWSKTWTEPRSLKASKSKGHNSCTGPGNPEIWIILESWNLGDVQVLCLGILDLPRFCQRFHCLTYFPLFFWNFLDGSSILFARYGNGESDFGFAVFSIFNFWNLKFHASTKLHQNLKDETNCQ